MSKAAATWTSTPTEAHSHTHKLDHGLPAADSFLLPSLLPRPPNLAAPEVHREEPYNEKADVFSFAVLMYQMFARTVLAIEMKNGPHKIANAGE